MAVKPKARKGLAGILDVSIQSTQLLTGKSVPLRAVEILGRKKWEAGVLPLNYERPKLQ